MSATQTFRPTSVDELRRAWHAVQAGEFHHPRPTSSASSVADLSPTLEPAPAPALEPAPAPALEPAPAPVSESAPASVSGGVWTPPAGVRVVPVVGVMGSCGTTTVGLALATAADGPAVVVECTSASASGLAAASTAEMGQTGDGWLYGVRNHDRDPNARVGLYRTTGVHLSPDSMPVPPAIETEGWLVVDVGYRPEQVHAGSGWLSDLLPDAPTVVVVARGSVPGLRRLESTLQLFDPTRTVVAVVGPVLRRWSRRLVSEMGPTTRSLADQGRLVVFEDDRLLAVNGLTPDRLPDRLVGSAGEVLSLLVKVNDYAQ